MSAVNTATHPVTC